MIVLFVLVPTNLEMIVFCGTESIHFAIDIPIPHNSAARFIESYTDAKPTSMSRTFLSRYPFSPIGLSTLLISSRPVCRQIIAPKYLSISFPKIDLWDLVWVSDVFDFSINTTFRQLNSIHPVTKLALNSRDNLLQISLNPLFSILTSMKKKLNQVSCGSLF